jgi:transposase-like protein
MAQNPTRGTLSEGERLEIVRLYSAGGQTYQSLADTYGVHKSTISRIINGQNKKLQGKQSTDKTTAAAPSTPQTIIESDAGVIVDPLAFRQAKLSEIARDINSTRERGSLHALPQFHRLHVAIHDEWTQMRTDAEEIDGVTNPDELLATIALAVKGLPPVLKDRLIDMLEGAPLQMFDGGAD